MMRTVLLIAAVFTLSARVASAQWTNYSCAPGTCVGLTSTYQQAFVGISTDASEPPVGRFDVRFPDGTWKARVSFDDREMYLGNRVSTDNPSIRFYRPTGSTNSSGSTTYVWWIENSQGAQSSQPGGLAFRTRSNPGGSAQDVPGAEGGVDMATRMIIQGDGNIGIGTTTPSHLLSVNGAIKAREVIVTDLGWADFVFEPEYDLMPLGELAQFIEEEGHLPDVPTTAEVEANGANLGDMPALLLQKVEELTLYVIEQNAEIERLRASVRELQGAGE